MNGYFDQVVYLLKIYEIVRIVIDVLAKSVVIINSRSDEESLYDMYVMVSSHISSVPISVGSFERVVMCHLMIAHSCLVLIASSKGGNMCIPRISSVGGYVMWPFIFLKSSMLRSYL